MTDYDRYRRLRFSLMVTTTLLVFLVAGITAYQIYSSYVITIDNAEQRLLGYAKALEEHASRAFGEAEKTLDITLDRISSSRASGRLTEKTLHDMLKSEIAKLPQVEAAFIVDRKGIFKAFSKELPATRLDVSDRDYFINLRDDPNAEIYISRAFRNRTNNMWRFTIAKKIPDRKGGFNGVVAIGFKPEYFDNFYKSMDIGASTRINIMRIDASTLIVSPSNDVSYEQNFSDRDLYKKYLPVSSTGFYRSLTFGYDLSDRIAAYSRLSSFPALALVSVQTDEILSEWKSQTTRQISFTAVVLIVFALTSVLLTRQLKKLEESERKLNDRSLMLAENDERFRFAEGIAHLGSWDWDISKRKMAWSDEIYRMYGLKPQETQASHKAFLERIHPEDAQKVTTALDRSLEDKSIPYDVEHRIIRLDGTERVVHEIGQIFRDEMSKPIRMFSVMHDITERKRAEEEHISHLQFLESLERIDGAIRQAGNLEGMMSDVLDTTFSIFNSDRAWLLFPCDPDAPSWRVPMERTRPEYPGVFAMGSEIPMSSQGRETFMAALNSDGPIVNDPQSGYPVPQEISSQFSVRSQIMIAVYPKIGKPWVFGMHQCSYQRVWSEKDKSLLKEIARRITDGLSILLFLKDLQESEQRFRALVENLPMKVYIKDRESVYVACNPSYAVDLGINPEGIRGRTDYDFHPRELAEQYRMDDKRIMESGQGEELDEDYILYGRHNWVHTIKIPLMDSAHNVTGILGVLWDITERKETEEALSSAEKKYRNLLESVQLAAVMLDVEGNLTFCNDYILRQTGWSRDDVLGKNWFDLFIPSEARSAAKVNFKSAIAEDTLPLHYENLIVTRDGTQRLIVWDNSILRNSEESIIGVASIGTDATEHRKLEDQLRQAQKMEAIGALAGGVAHDFNNILSAIVGYAALVQIKMKTDDPLRPHIEQILASSERATGLTKSLLAFSRKQVIELKPVNINDVVFGFHKLLTRLIGEDIEFRVIPAREDMIVEADQGQLEQVLMNLATNARDAMPTGGILEIKTDKITIDSDLGDIKKGDYAVLSVSDTGSGIDKSARDHIYEPFFTTKDVGKGTGLGLAIVYGIIHKHNGTIHFYSEPGQGTTFKIYLPLIPSAVKQMPHTNFVMPPSGTETILLVEDDKSVRAVTKAMLEEFGYTVVEAVDGEDAIKLFQENKGKIQLVLCDLIMPKINGKETFEQIKKIRPDIKGIFISGYTSDIIAQKGVMEDGVNFISKPLSTSDLFNKIREVLES
jgi:two-component system, cell cycle sensor histidine kinase and response regulator CckA